MICSSYFRCPVFTRNSYRGIIELRAFRCEKLHRAVLTMRGVNTTGLFGYYTYELYARACGSTSMSCRGASIEGFRIDRIDPLSTPVIKASQYQWGNWLLPSRALVPWSLWVHWSLWEVKSWIFDRLGIWIEQEFHKFSISIDAVWVT